MSTPLDLSTDRRPDGTWVMTVAGEIDMSNAGVFQQSLVQARARAQEGQPDLLVDLRAVEYLDTAGLTSLFAYVKLSLLFGAGVRLARRGGIAAHRALMGIRGLAILPAGGAFVLYLRR